MNNNQKENLTIDARTYEVWKEWEGKSTKVQRGAYVGKRVCKALREYEEDKEDDTVLCWSCADDELSEWEELQRLEEEKEEEE